MTDNISAQAEELQVLESIFPNEWKACNLVPHRYIADIEKDVQLCITLHEFYPLNKPPEYEIWAPKLNQYQRDDISENFRKIFIGNRGCPVIVQWIECLKNILKKKNYQKGTRSAKSHESKHTSCRNVNLNIVHGPSLTDKKSTFQGHVCKVTDVTQVRMFVNELIKNHKISNAKHNILAYRIGSDVNDLLEESDNDGEMNGATPIMYMLKTLNLTNIAVVVTRWYGGVHLGPNRFKCIKLAAQRVLVESGFAKS